MLNLDALDEIELDEKTVVGKKKTKRKAKKSGFLYLLEQFYKNQQFFFIFVKLNKNINDKLWCYKGTIK